MAQNFDFCWFPKIERRCKSFKSECVEDNSKLLLWQTAAYMNTSGCKIYGCEYWSDVWKIIRSGKHIHFPPGSHPYKDFSVDLTHSPPKFIICLQKCQNSFGILARIALLKRDVFTFQIDGFFKNLLNGPWPIADKTVTNSCRFSPSLASISNDKKWQRQKGCKIIVTLGIFTWLLDLKLGIGRNASGRHGLKMNNK